MARQPKKKFEDNRPRTWCCGQRTSHFDIRTIGGKPHIVCKTYPKPCN